VYIFTHRPWPDPEIKGQTEFVQRWRKAALESLEKLERGSDSGKVGLRTRARTEISRLRVKLSGRRYGLRLIDVITECWLVSNKIKFDKLIVERSSDDVSDPRGHFRNRFYISRQKSIRFFVEDDLEKANKLSYTCDVVFLYDQPYNASNQLPSNVIRVKSWYEIYQSLKKFS